MRKILILMGRYLPGHKDGGPLRTIINLTEVLGDEYEFRIVALDRDHGDTEPYPNIVMQTWNTIGNAKVWYVEPDGFSFFFLWSMSRQTDIVYLCGFYNDYAYKTLLLNRMGILYKTPVVIASMGLFSEGALAQKSLKKKLFISLLKLTGCFNNITWSVTSSLEEKDVKRYIGSKAKCIVAEDLPRTNVPGRDADVLHTDTLKVAFLSRISPKKNLIYAIEILAKVESNVEFTIYGPDEDKDYWKQCQKGLKSLPPNVRWSYFGDVPSEEVQSVLQKNDVFLFPTKGENYGHVIFEALSVGCIPIISDQTPWQAIQKNKAGYVFPLDEPSRFARSIDEIARMDVSEMNKMREAAVALAKYKVQQTKESTGYRIIFG